MPTTDPKDWVGTDDYPSRDLLEGHDGTIVFRLAIGPGGRVTGCDIVHSSGHPGLDQATCRLVSRGARFTPAMDGNGKTVAGTYSNSVKWRIPR